MYNTCPNRCLYCYANYNQAMVGRNFSSHDPLSPLITGDVGEGDKIHERQAGSCRDRQIRLFDV